MNKKDAVALVGAAFRDNTGYEEEIVNYFIECQNFYERQVIKPWFLHKTITSELTTEGYILYPNDFLSELEGERFYLMDEDDYPIGVLQKVDYKRGVKDYYGWDAGCPRAYAVRPGRWIFFPKPDTLYTPSITYAASEPRLDTIVNEASNRWLEYAGDLLVAYATKRLAGSLKEQEIMQGATQAEQQAWMRIVGETHLRTLTNVQPGWGVDDVDPC